MMRSIFVTVSIVLAVSLTGFGCARAARDTSGFSLREETVVNGAFETTWQTVKQVLRDQGYDLYTMDKRGVFVAYSPVKRILWMQPRRTKFTVELAQVSDTETALAVESIRQIYGVTLLTHPNWHDRKQTDPAPGQALVEGIRAKLAEGGAQAEAFVDEVNNPPQQPVENAPAAEMESSPLPDPADPKAADAPETK